MAREVYGAHTEWAGAPLERLEQLVALVRADEREQGQKWFEAVTAQHKQLILAEREACARIAEEPSATTYECTVACGGPAQTFQQRFPKHSHDIAKEIRARGNT
jgi:hypothetical protein